jgi:hypothetical protein
LCVGAKLNERSAFEALLDVLRSLLRRRLIAARMENRPSDVLAGEFVQCLWGGPTGFLRSKEANGIGLVWWFCRVGRYEIIDCRLLRKSPEPVIRGREAS